VLLDVCGVPIATPFSLQASTNLVDWRASAQFVSTGPTNRICVTNETGQGYFRIHP
jgi:hypothetical protein